LDGRRLRRAEIERQMRSLPVVMSDVFAKNAAEVALVEHDQPVERLVADGSNHALAVGVRPRSPVE
jgi:hypothetical protein